MTIFFDTTELNNDPLFYNHSMEILFELSKAEEIKICISEIVLSYELKKHYIGNFKEKLKLYNEASKKFYKFWNNKYNENEKVYNDNKIKSNFENRISKLIKDNYFTKVEFDHKNIIDFILDRYMESKAPFHKINKNDKKDYNWKDYIIWESYKTIMNNGKDKEYIFISNNTKEFSSDEKLVENYKGIYTMHNDFSQDIKGKVIRCYTDIYSFINQDKKYQDIYKKYLIKKYKKSNDDKSIIEELFLFTAKIIDKYSYPDNSYSIKKINIPNDIDIKTNGIKNNININITVDNKDNLKTGEVDKNGNSQKQKNIDKVRDNQKQKSYNEEEETIHTKCSFTLDLQKLNFKISSIGKFRK